MCNEIVGVNGDEGTPVPIPNTVVKLVYGDNTWLATAWEDNSTPTSKQQRKLLLFLLHKMQENLFFFPIFLYNRTIEEFFACCRKIHCFVGRPINGGRNVMSIQENCRVVENTRLGEGLYLMVLDAPEIVKLTQCGQFVHIACGEGHLLRRPISICTWQGSHLRIVFQVKGDGTKWLSERKVGDVLDVLGPLGHGFDVQALGDRPIFIGGGIGVPPMLGCVRTAVEKGAQPAAILGFRNKGAVILEGDFRDECETFVTTDDGTYARHGFVTDVLKEQVAGATGVAACGPKPMLKAIAAIAKEVGVPCQVSMEERMGCGIGACLVCACALKAENGETRYGHVCKDGPVFDAKEVAW